MQLNKQIDKRIIEIAEILKITHKTNPGLTGGKSGEILFWAYYSQYTKDYSYIEKVTLLLSDIFDEIKNGYKYPKFSDGLAGIGWTVEHLAQNNFLSIDTNKVIGNLDDFLYPYMMDYIRKGNYDYLHGALGIGLYYINRNSNSNTHKYLSDLVDELEKLSINISGDIAWETNLILNSDLKGYNLGLSHGIASIITILGKIYEKNICKEKVSYLITGAVNFLLKSKRHVSINTSYYPAWVCKKEPDMTGRLAWCYYDLGIAVTLWQIGNLFNNEIWKKESIDIILNTTRYRDLKEAWVVDAGLCHGTAGIAHIYNRMYDYANIDTLKEAALFWFEQSLKMANFNDGLVGYKTYNLPEYGGWKNDYGFLTGISGIGLAMISAVSDIKPNWDSALLLS